ncbi:M15 family metallopeptidase [Flavobacterium rivuli]|uniref:M15 family metallopeptidase n=1 Tax=Flavobacterium rivuli TaxID=498301 RepID=UPI00035C60A7|nr:M15 family metallopeptidase [Flavobacterium rivuli]
MDNLTLTRINYMHPAVRQEVLTAYKHINNTLFGKNIRLRFTHTLRTFNEQDTLYAIGRTKPGKKVTNARAGQSAHNYGLAFDIAILIDKNGDGIFETASWNTTSDDDKDGTPDWTEAVNYLKKVGWAWGGEWRSFPDYPHFEKTFGHSWKSLQAKYNVGDVFSEVINGMTYKWVNL